MARLQIFKSFVAASTQAKLVLTYLFENKEIVATFVS